jgi:hypothetical protein
MTTRRRNTLLLALVLLLGALGFYFGGSAKTPSALDAVPAESFIVATIDMRLLRASPFAGKIGSLGEGGMAEVKARCGFDPLARASEMAVCVPEEEAPGEFGVVARGEFDRFEVASCAEKLAEARGSKTHVREVNGFTVVEDEGDERTISRIALGHSGPIIVGAGKWLDTMMDVARTGRGSVRNDEAHASLREAVTQGAAPAIVVTAILPKKMRERVRDSLGDVQGQAASAMAGVLGVSQAAFAFSPGTSGSKASLVVELRCESEAQCASVKKLIERKKTAAADDLGLRLVGIGALLGDIQVEQKGAVVRATLTHDADDLARIAENAFEAAMSQRQTPGGDAKIVRPDENIAFARDAGPGP